MFRKEPGLLKAAEDEFRSRFLSFNSLLTLIYLYFYKFVYCCYSIIVDLPPNARLDDLASLLTLDSKNLDKDKLGIDAIKRQQEINLKFSSDRTVVIPDDRTQIMLASVSTFLARSNVVTKMLC